MWARNLETGRYGVSLFQITYGRNPFLPEITEGNVTTDQDIPEDDILRSHFKAQEDARSFLRKAEAEQRIKML